MFDIIDFIIIAAIIAAIVIGEIWYRKQVKNFNVHEHIKS